MKLLKTISAVMLLSVIVFSCKNTKKEEGLTTDEVVVEETVATEADDEAVEEAGEDEAVEDEAVEETEEAEKQINVVYPRMRILPPKQKRLLKDLLRTIRI